MDGGAWWAAVHGVAKSRTRMSDFTFTFHFHALEKEMATLSSVLAWRIPGMGEPGGLLSMGSHRVGHDWSDLAAAAAAWRGLPGSSVVKNLPANVGDSSSIPESRRSPEEGNSNPLQYSCLGNSMDRRAYRAGVYSVAKKISRKKNWARTHCGAKLYVNNQNSQLAIISYYILSMCDPFSYSKWLDFHYFKTMERVLQFATSWMDSKWKLYLLCKGSKWHQDISFFSFFMLIIISGEHIYKATAFHSGLIWKKKECHLLLSGANNLVISFILRLGVWENYLILSNRLGLNPGTSWILS